MTCLILLTSVLLLFSSVLGLLRHSPEVNCPPFTCQIPCPKGYAKDSKGCQICGDCLLANGSATGELRNPGGDPLHQDGGHVSSGASVTGNSDFLPCIPGTSCALKCPNDYLKGPGFCDFCVCANPISGQHIYNMPCPDEPTVCDVCTNGYVSGNGGCQLCECRTDVVMTTTTTAPTTTTTVSPAFCILHYTKCQLQHPLGFMSDRDCTLCIDKDVIYKNAGIPPNLQPTIRLSNPCVQGFDICKIFCSTGYKSGPRSCHFCACLH